MRNFINDHFLIGTKDLGIYNVGRLLIFREEQMAGIMQWGWIGTKVGIDLHKY